MTPAPNDPVALLRLDQRNRWLTGERVLVEAYLEEHAWLRMDPEGLLDLVYNEIVLREEYGSKPPLEEYVQRFPELVDQLRLQFAVHWVIEEAPSPREDAPDRERAEPLPDFPGFEILDELGRGGMGVVYRARQLSLKRLVALKVIRTGTHASPRERTRFRTEAEVVARLQHPNIVQIHEVGHREGLPYLCLEFVSGPSLDRAVGGAPMPPRPSAELVETLARAMHYAHQQGIVHRDLKPANILLQKVASSQQPVASSNAPVERSSSTDYWLLTTDYSPKITDFGLAKLLDDQNGPSTSQALVGTPHYMAPEQALDRGDLVGPRTDIYALGAILYELLTGQPPFQGDSVLEILEQVRWQEPERPEKLRPGLPRDLQSIILKCLDKEPGRRYDTAVDLAEDLRRFLAYEPVLARPAGIWDRSLKAVRRRPAVASLLVIIALGAIALVLLDRQRRADVEAVRERTRTEERLEQADRSERARAQFDSFARDRGTALFHGVHGTLFSEGASASDRETTWTAALRALEHVGMSPAAHSPPNFNPMWSADEKAEVETGCIQLFLLLADLTATRQPEAEAGERRQALQEALALLDSAARLLPSTQACHLQRSLYLTRLGDEVGARLERERAARTLPERSMDFFLLGDEQLRQGDVQTAALSFQKALLLEPNGFWSHYLLATCQLKLQRFPEAEAHLTKCLSLWPDVGWARMLRGYAHGQMNAIERAEADFQAAQRKDPSVDLEYAVCVARGLLRFRSRQYEDAATELSRAIALRPDQFHARVSLAKAYQALRKWEESNRAFEAALRLPLPRRIAAECRAEQSRNFFLSKQYSAALTAAGLALKAAPDFADGWLRQGLALLELKRYAEARKSLDRYQAAGGNPGADFFRSRGRILVQLGDFLGALDDYTRALELDPDSELWVHRGWAYFFADAWRPALRDFEEGLRLDPKNVDALVGRGLTHVLLGQTTEGLKDAEEAWRRAPDSPEMMHNLACTFAQSGLQLAKDSPAKNGGDLAERCRQRALEAVRKTLSLVPAAERGQFWREKILPEAALESIRRSPQFEELGKELSGMP